MLNDVQINQIKSRVLSQNGAEPNQTQIMQQNFQQTLLISISKIDQMISELDDFQIDQILVIQNTDFIKEFIIFLHSCGIDYVHTKEELDLFDTCIKKNGQLYLQKLDPGVFSLVLAEAPGYRTIMSSLVIFLNHAIKGTDSIDQQLEKGCQEFMFDVSLIKQSKGLLKVKRSSLLQFYSDLKLIVPCFCDSDVKIVLQESLFSAFFASYQVAYEKQLANDPPQDVFKSKLCGMLHFICLIFENKILMFFIQREFSKQQQLSLLEHEQNNFFQQYQQLSHNQTKINQIPMNGHRITQQYGSLISPQSCNINKKQSQSILKNNNFNKNYSTASTATNTNNKHLTLNMQTPNTSLSVQAHPNSNGQLIDVLNSNSNNNTNNKCQVMTTLNNNQNINSAPQNFYFNNLSTASTTCSLKHQKKSEPPPQTAKQNKANSKRRADSGIDRSNNTNNNNIVVANANNANQNTSIQPPLLHMQTPFQLQQMYPQINHPPPHQSNSYQSCQSGKNANNISLSMASNVSSAGISHQQIALQQQYQEHMQSFYQNFSSRFMERTQLNKLVLNPDTIDNQMRQYEENSSSHNSSSRDSSASSNSNGSNVSSHSQNHNKYKIGQGLRNVRMHLNLNLPQKQITVMSDNKSLHSNQEIAKTKTSSPKKQMQIIKKKKQRNDDISQNQNSNHYNIANIAQPEIGVPVTVPGIVTVTVTQKMEEAQNNQQSEINQNSSFTINDIAQSNNNNNASEQNKEQQTHQNQFKKANTSATSNSEEELEKIDTFPDSCFEKNAIQVVVKQQAQNQHQHQNLNKNLNQHKNQAQAQKIMHFHQHNYLNDEVHSQVSSPRTEGYSRKQQQQRIRANRLQQNFKYTPDGKYNIKKDLALVFTHKQDQEIDQNLFQNGLSIQNNNNNDINKKINNNNNNNNIKTVSPHRLQTSLSIQNHNQTNANNNVNSINENLSEDKYSFTTGGQDLDDGREEEELEASLNMINKQFIKKISELMESQNQLQFFTHQNAQQNQQQLQMYQYFYDNPWIINVNQQNSSSTSNIINNYNLLYSQESATLQYNQNLNRMFAPSVSSNSIIHNNAINNYNIDINNNNNNNFMMANQQVHFMNNNNNFNYMQQQLQFGYGQQYHFQHYQNQNMNGYNNKHKQNLYNNNHHRNNNNNQFYGNKQKQMQMHQQNYNKSNQGQNINRSVQTNTNQQVQMQMDQPQNQASQKGNKKQNQKQKVESTKNDFQNWSVSVQTSAAAQQQQLQQQQQQQILD